MKIKYISKKFRQTSLVQINLANDIIANYENQGFRLTLRQLYYQMVANAYIPNSQKSYSNFGRLISDARMTGFIDWQSIEDRTRRVYKNSHWDHPSGVIKSARQSFHLDYWENQDYRPRVWIEKEALSGVISGICNELDVPYLACRGYMSQTAMHNDARLAKLQIKGGLKPIIIHLGDHDPSGIDMTRDIEDRMEVFKVHGIAVIRVALNMDQVEQYNPPPNPAKLSDSRAEKYIDNYGSSSWELDALDPATINDLIRSEIEVFINPDIWAETKDSESRHVRSLEKMEENYDKIIEFLEKK